VVVRSGGRVRAAMRCPYCHDQVGRQDALACARRGCGALYHRECWEECARWGGCAALGCGSREAREVSALGYVVRVLRLVLAAVLFPRRVVGALVANEGASIARVFSNAWRLAWAVVPSQDPTKNSYGALVVYVLLSIGFLASIIAALIRLDRFNTPAERMVVPIAVVVVTLGVPFLLALLATTGFFALRALALAFRGELAAFGRQDAPVRSERPPPKKDPAD
jgi:hypothetical protein